MPTMTLYRPIGTAEYALLQEASWRNFPAMPQGYAFFAYTSPPEDVLEWKDRLADIENFDAWEVGQEEVVSSWTAWNNSHTVAFVVAFEVDADSSLKDSRGWRDQAYEVDEVNKALIGPITIYHPKEDTRD